MPPIATILFGAPRLILHREAPAALPLRADGTAGDPAKA
jgi:hypothetical protein